MRGRCHVDTLVLKHHENGKRVGELVNRCTIGAIMTAAYTESKASMQTKRALNSTLYFRLCASVRVRITVP